MARRPIAWLAVAGLAMLALRLAFILAFPDAESDAHVHIDIARGLLRNPTNIAAHWVWLPGWHFLLAALLAAGASHQAVRALVAVAQTAAPFLLYDLVRRTDPSAPPADALRARRVACLAALAYTIAPLPNLLATSANPETAVSLMILAASWALARNRFWLAGAALLVASAMRYEAWGAVAIFMAYVLARNVRGKHDPPWRALVAAVAPVVFLCAWLVARRETFGTWLDFVASTRAFADHYRAGTGRSAIVDSLVLPLLLPFAVVGPALPLVFVGARRAWRPHWIFPLGTLAFLVASFSTGGSIALPRYLTALTPFAVVAMVEGARSSRPRLERGLLIASLGTLALMTLGYFARASAMRG